MTAWVIRSPRSASRRSADNLLRLQADATTVRLRLYRGDRFDDVPGLADAQLGQVPGLGALAAGVMKVGPLAFLRHLTTLRAADPGSVAHSGGLFMKRLLRAYTSGGTRAD